MKMISWWKEPIHRQAAWILLLGLAFRTVCAALLHPGFDEAYYFVYTQHLDWSYFDHPPLVAWTTGIGTWLTGVVSQFTIRIGSLLTYTATLVLVYLTGTHLFSPRAGLLALAIASITPIFQITFGILTLPDVPLMVFWMAALYTAVLEFFPDDSGTYRPTLRLALISLWVGLACLGKYHGFALGTGLVGFCLTSPRHRSALVSPWTALGVLLFLLALSPVLVWNLQHDWISFRFQSNRVSEFSGYRLLDLLGVFLIHVAYLFPPIGLPMWWVSLRQVWQQFQPQLQPTATTAPAIADLRLKQQLLFWLSLPLVWIFTLMGGYRQVLPSWPMPGFFGITFLLGQQAELWLQQSHRGVRRWLQGSAIAVASLLLFALFHVIAGTVQKAGIYSIAGGIWPVKDDPSTQLIDIRQVRQGLRQSPALQTVLQQSAFVFTDNFFVAGQLGMALATVSDRPVTCLAEDLRGFAFWSRDDQWLGQDAVYIASQRFQIPNAVEYYRQYFAEIIPLGEIVIRRGGSTTEVLLVYRATQMLKPYPRPYGLKSG